MPELHQLPPKREVGQALLARGTVFVHLDPRATGVVVPPWLRDQPQLVLQIGHDMPVPIPDLEVDEQGVSATLSFNRCPYTCHVTWASVFALVGDDGRGMVWPDSMPPEIAAEVDREARRRHREPPAPEQTEVIESDGDGVVRLTSRASGDAAAAADSSGGEEARADDALETHDALHGPEGPESQGSEPPAEARDRTLAGRKLPPYLRVIK